MRNLGCRGGYGTNKEGGFRIWKVVLWWFVVMIGGVWAAIGGVWGGEV